MTKKKLLILLAIAVGVAVIVIVNIKMSYESSVDVEVTPVKPADLVERVSGPGVIYAEASVKVSSSVMGRISALRVKDGARVDPGDILVEIEASQYEARLNQAQASYRAALAVLELSKARHEEARTEMERSTRLHERELVSKRDLDRARTALEVAEAEVGAAEERSREAAATLSAFRDDLDKTVISSPIAGTVTGLNVEEGEIVITGTMNNPGTVLMTISGLDTMEVRAEIDETDVARVATGQEVEINVDAFPDTVLLGVVSVVGSSTSFTSGRGASSGERSTFDIRIRILDYQPGLRPGMTTTVDIITAEADSVSNVPLQALVLREWGEGDDKEEIEGIFTVDGGRARFRPVRTGISDDKNIEIFQDLDEDIKVVTGPFRVLRDLEDSVKVKITKTKE
jgi:HlyD family secretion protein